MKLPSFRPAIVALGALVFWGLSFDAFGGRGHLHETNAMALRALGANEAIFYVTAATVQVFFVAGLGLCLARLWGSRADRIAAAVLRRRSTLVVLAVAGAATAFALSVLVLHQHTLTEDEKTYLFQAKLLLLRKLTIVMPPDTDALREPFIVGAQGHWSGQYFWAQPALLALGLLAHAVYVIPALEVACTVFFTGLLVEELTSDRRAASLAALLVAMSPIVLLTGATLLNATLSAACIAVTLWSLARLHRGPSRPATYALGLATGIALHNRLLDQAALLSAAACVLTVAHFRSPLPIVRRLLPAVVIALPLLALHLFINKAVSGDWRHSGYWLQYLGRGWTTMGFGTGPGGFHQDREAAFSKTIANAVRMMFYTAGGPLIFAPLVLVEVAGRPNRLLRAGAWVALVYAGAYFLYASAPIQTTGPVYFDALVPVLAGCAAVAAVNVHDAVKGREAFRRLVPGFVLAQLAAAVFIFWPSAVIEVGRSAKDSASCDDLASTLDPVKPALVFVAPGVFHDSWTFWRPMSSPLLDDRILFPEDEGPARNAALAARFGVGRASYLAHCVAEPLPRIERYDPVTGKASPIEGK